MTQLWHSILNDFRSSNQKKAAKVAGLKTSAPNISLFPETQESEETDLEKNIKRQKSIAVKKEQALEDIKPVVDDKRGVPPMLQGLDIYEVVEIREKEGATYAEIIKNITQDIVEVAH